MRLLLLFVLGCSGAATELSSDASVDGLAQTFLSPGISPASPQVSSTHSMPRMTYSVAAGELAERLKRFDRSWMWAATLLPDGVAPDDLELRLPPQYGLARTTQLARVTMFQTVGVDVARDGVAVSAPSPVIAGRGLRVRAYVEGGVGSLILGRLRWESGGTTTLFVGSMRVEEPSDDADPESLFEFVVPKELVAEDATFSVDILEDQGAGFSGPSRARFPMDGRAQPLGAEASMRIDVRILPMRYEFDGSMRTPDISAAQIAALREQIEAVMPVVEANVEVLPARDYEAQLRRDSFDDHVDALHQVIAWRAADAPPSATYYVALVSPEASFSEYCAGGCYAGIAPLNETNVAFQRASVVVWYGASTSGWTAIHELGHALGRSHVACGDVSGEDPDYPYAGGEVGVWGLDQRSGLFVEPTHHDFMSYCSNEWVSDYTYAAMAERLRSHQSVPSTFVRVPSASRRLITTGAEVRWSHIAVPSGVVGEPTELIAIDDQGRRRRVPAERIRYSIDGPSSYAVHVDSDVRAFIVEGVRLEVAELD